MKKLLYKIYSLNKKLIIGISYFVAFNISSHALVISEIMYDPAGSDTGYEWIEVYNDSSSDIDLSKYKFFESNVNHGLTAHTGGNILKAFSYAIIADVPANFLATYPAPAYPVFDSSFSLSNSGEYLEMRDANNTNLFSVTYVINENSNGTGYTLNYKNNSWFAAIPTPGAEAGSPATNTGQSTNTSTTNSSSTSSTTVSANNNTNTNNSSNISAVNYSQGYTSRTYSLGDLQLVTPKEIYTTVGASTNFFVKPLDKNKNVIVANNYWSFGDGASGYGTNTFYIYRHAGVYTAFVESEVSNAYGLERINVIVSNPDLALTNYNSDGLTIKNNSNQEINIGGFIVASNQGFYKLSRQLIILPDAQVLIPNDVMGLNVNNPNIALTNIRLLNAANQIVASYTASNANSVVTAKSASTSSSTLINFASSSVMNIKKKQIVKNVPKYNIPIAGGVANKSSSAVATTTKTVDNTPIKKSKNWLYWLYE
jgi:hypothetical protein